MVKKVTASLLKKIDRVNMYYERAKKNGLLKKGEFFNNKKDMFQDITGKDSGDKLVSSDVGGLSPSDIERLNSKLDSFLASPYKTLGGTNKANKERIKTYAKHWTNGDMKKARRFNAYFKNEKVREMMDILGYIDYQVLMNMANHMVSPVKLGRKLEELERMKFIDEVQAKNWLENELIQ